MSEHRYYEFRALDGTLSDEEQRELREISSRAEITSTRFTNQYDWGDLSGDTDEMLEQYFDAYLHVTNYGTRELAFRLPLEAVDVDTWLPYSCEYGFEVWTTDEHACVRWSPRLEPDDDPEWWRHEENLRVLIPIRDQIRRGDRRALYLGWLMAVRDGWPDHDAPEPPVPEGLGDRDEPLEALVEFLMLDDELLGVATEANPDVTGEPSEEKVREWLEEQPDDQRLDWLVQACQGDTSELETTVYRALQSGPGWGELDEASRRTAEDIREQAGLIEVR
jgi:hypothetical protein